MSNPKEFPLHNLVKRGRELDGAGWPGRAQILLENNQDLNLLDTLNQTPFGSLVSSGVANRYAGRIAQLLIEHGANPLINDCAILAAVKQAYPDQGGNSQLVVPALQAILKKEKNEPLRGERDENIIQLLARDIPYTLFDWFEKKNWAVELKEDIPEDWIFSKDQNGNNLLHLMWRKDINLNHMEEYECENIWQATGFLDHHGIDFKALNTEGDSVSGLIKSHISNGFPIAELVAFDKKNERIWQKVEALIIEEELEKQTPAVIQQKHRSNRL